MGIIFSSPRASVVLINCYAITFHRAPFSTQLPDNENIGGKGTFITVLPRETSLLRVWPRNYF